MKRAILRKWCVRLSIAALAAFSVVVWAPGIALGSPSSANPPTHFSKSGGRFTLPGHLVPALKQIHSTGRTAGERRLDLSISLAPRNTDALDALIAAQNDPHSGLYHHYLTPQEYNASFAPTQASVNAVVAFLRGQGIVVRPVASNRMLIDATGSVSSVERAFGVTLADYNLHGRSVYAPVNNPSVPSSLAGMIVNVGGLDNVALQHHTQAPVVADPHAGSGPGGGYTPSELRTAYDMNSLISTANGSGQTVAIFELDSYKASDVNQYLSFYGLGSANYSNVVVDGASTTPGAGAIEVELDMEDVSAIASGATQKIYIGPNSTQGVNDTYNRIVTDNTAKVTSTSWGLCEASSGTSELTALDNIFQQGAAQGQAFFAAAGDSGAYDCNNSSLAVDSPADDPHVVGVGGTTLNTGSGGSYSSESVWSNPSDTSRSPMGAGGGGGLSTFFTMPSYQSGPGVQNQYSNGEREVPDVSADADPNTGYSVYCTVTAAGCNSSGWIAVGGTSAAAPLWAGVAADTNQYLAANGKPVLGSASAELYTLFNTAQTFTAYHDVTSGNNLFYPATSGYDLASGVGTPDVWNLARDAAGSTGGGGSPPSISSFSPTSGAVGTSVTISGANFTGATAVKFNGTSASYTVNSASQITATVPSGATSGPISVTTPSGSATSSSSFTVTTGGGGGTTTQMLANPGFENGQSPWQESSAGGYQIVDPTNPHTGSYSAYLCGYDFCNDQIWQTVTLPSTTTKVVLSYWTYIDTYEASGSPCYDYFYAKIRNSSGGTITTVQTQCNKNTHGWTQYTFDVTSATNSYHGQQIQVYFQGTTDVSLPSDFFVDDVALNVTH